MRISMPLAVALTAAATLTVTSHSTALSATTSTEGAAAHHVAVRQSAGAYAYFPPNRPDRVVATWDRSIPVTYVIARRQAQPRMLATIQEAFRRARVQTGIRFRYGGRVATLKSIGTAQRPVVTIDFGTNRSHPRLAPYTGPVHAVGGPFLITHDGTTSFTGGQITIDVAATRGVGLGFRHSQLGATLMHEIGHVLGLTHVRSPGQLMAPGRIRANISGWFHDGDLAGLRRLIHS